MAVLMLAILIAFVILAYRKRDLLSPWFLLCIALLATFVIVLLNYENWSVKISGIFIAYISSAIMAFGLGTVLVDLRTPKAIVANKIKFSIGEANIKKKYPANMLIILSAIFALVYIINLVVDIGPAESFSAFIRKVYDTVVSTSYTPGFFFSQMPQAVRAIAYMNVYRLLIRMYSRDDKMSRIKLIIPVLIFIGTAIISSDRNIFLRFGIFSICMWVVIFRENAKGRNINGKIIKRAAVLLILMIFIFFLFGKLKQYKSDFINSISIYGGSGLYNFNLWVQSFEGPLLFGKSTFSTFLGSIERLLSPFGVSFELVARFDPFIMFTSSNGYFYSSNIYSALQPYVQDFGYFGVILFPFILGVFFQWLFNKMKKNKYGFLSILFCMLIYPIIFFPILEQFFRRFSFGMVYEIAWTTIFYFSVYGFRKKKSCVQDTLIKER